MKFSNSLLLLAYRNLSSRKARSVAAGGGICLAIFLIFLQWGFLQAAKTQSTLLYEFFDFDLALVSNRYQFLYSADTFDRIRLTQARALPSIDDSFNLNIGRETWVDPATLLRSSLMLIGVDAKPEFILNEKVRHGLDKLRGDRTAMIDEFSHPDYGELKLGKQALINQREIDIVGFIELGMFFYAEGSALVDNIVFLKLNGRSGRATTVGMLRLKDGFKPGIEREKLKRLLPVDVVVLTKDELIRQEQAYFVSVKPLGIIFRVGVFIAFATGFVILFQIISTDIGTRMKEYATLKAMGFGPHFIYGMVFAQISMLCLGSFVPAVVMSTWVFRATNAVTHLPVQMTPRLFGFVLLLAIGMCLMAGVASLNKLHKAHPAELF